MISKQHGPAGLPALLALALLLGCGTDTEPSQAPAHVENPVQESDLTTIHLSPEAEHRIGIEVGAVEERALQRRRSLGGELMAPPGGAMAVNAPRAGMIVAPEGGTIPGAGASVRAGQPLLRLVALPVGDEILGGSGALTVAEGRLENARAKADRAEALLREGIGSRAESEDARAELLSAQGAFDAVRARTELLETGQTTVDLSSLSPMVLSAPAGGVVRERHVTTGQTVSAGTPLMEIVDADPLWVRVPIYVGVLREVDREAQATVIRHGSGVGGEGLSAVAISGPPTADPGAVSADLYYRVGNPAGDLRAGERVEVMVPLRGAETQGTVVPWAAVLYDTQGGTWIYEALADHAYTRRRVEVKDVLEGYAILARGPAPGTPVVVVGAAELYSTEFGTAH